MAVTLDIIQSRITTAHAVEKQRQTVWNPLMRMLQNEFGHVTLPSGEAVSKLAPNFLHSHLQRLVPSLYFDDPHFYATAEHIAYQDRSEAVSDTLAFYWRACKVKPEMRQVVTDALIYRVGCCVVGIPIPFQAPIRANRLEEQRSQAEQETVLLMQGQFAEVAPDDLDEIHLEVHEAVLADPRSDALWLSVPQARPAFDAHVDAHRAQQDAKAKEDTVTGLLDAPLPVELPFIQRVSPRHIFWEPDVTRWQDSAYLLHRRYARLVDLQDNAFYQQTSDLQATAIDPETLALLGIDAQTALAKHPELARVELFECWDARTQTVSTWATGHPSALRAPDDVPYHEIDGYPFRFLTFFDLPDLVAGPSLLEYILFTQEMLMRLYAQVGDHTDKSGAVDEVVEPFLTEDSKAHLEDILNDPTHRRALLVRQPGALRPVQQPYLDQAIPTLITMLQQGIAEDTGVSDEQRGVPRSGTATQASIVGSAVNILVQDKINRVRDFQVEVAHLLIGVLKEYAPPSQELLILHGNAPHWFTFKREDLEPGYQLTIEMASPAESEREFMKYLNIWHEFRGHPLVNEAELIQEIFTRAGHKAADRFLRDPDPVTQAAIAHEHQLMQMGAAVQPTPGEPTAVHLQAHQQAFQQAQAQIQPMMAQMQQAVLQQNPMAAQDPQMMQQGMMAMMQQTPQMAQGQQFMQLLGQHIQQTQALMGGGQPPAGRRRNTAGVAYPTGNDGKVESILSAQISGG